MSGPDAFKRNAILIPMTAEMAEDAAVFAPLWRRVQQDMFDGLLAYLHQLELDRVHGEHTRHRPNRADLDVILEPERARRRAAARRARIRAAAHGRPAGPYRRPVP